MSGPSQDETLELEEWMWHLACSKNIYVIGLFECSKNEKRGEMNTRLSECYNIVTIYRELTLEEMGNEVNVAEDFFAHI